MDAYQQRSTTKKNGQKSTQKESSFDSKVAVVKENNNSRRKLKMALSASSVRTCDRIARSAHLFELSAEQERRSDPKTSVVASSASSSKTCIEISSSKSNPSKNKSSRTSASNIDQEMSLLSGALQVPEVNSTVEVKNNPEILSFKTSSINKNRVNTLSTSTVQLSPELNVSVDGKVTEVVTCNMYTGDHSKVAITGIENSTTNYRESHLSVEVQIPAQQQASSGTECAMVVEENMNMDETSPSDSNQIQPDSSTTRQLSKEERVALYEEYGIVMEEDTNVDDSSNAETLETSSTSGTLRVNSLSSIEQSTAKQEESSQLEGPAIRNEIHANHGLSLTPSTTSISATNRQNVRSFETETSTMQNPTSTHNGEADDNFDAHDNLPPAARFCESCVIQNMRGNIRTGNTADSTVNEVIQILHMLGTHIDRLDILLVDQKGPTAESDRNGIPIRTRRFIAMPHPQSAPHQLVVWNRYKRLEAIAELTNLRHQLEFILQQGPFDMEGNVALPPSFFQIPRHLTTLQDYQNYLQRQTNGNDPFNSASLLQNELKLNAAVQQLRDIAFEINGFISNQRRYDNVTMPHQVITLSPNCVINPPQYYQNNTITRDQAGQNNAQIANPALPRNQTLQQASMSQERISNLQHCHNNLQNELRQNAVGQQLQNGELLRNLPSRNNFTIIQFIPTMRNPTVNQHQHFRNDLLVQIRSDVPCNELVLQNRTSQNENNGSMNRRTSSNQRDLNVIPCNVPPQQYLPPLHQHHCNLTARNQLQISVRIPPVHGNVFRRSNTAQHQNNLMISHQMTPQNVLQLQWVHCPGGLAAFQRPVVSCAQPAGLPLLNGTDAADNAYLTNNPNYEPNQMLRSLCNVDIPLLSLSNEELESLVNGHVVVRILERRHLIAPHNHNSNEPFWRGSRILAHIIQQIGGSVFNPPHNQIAWFLLVEICRELCMDITIRRLPTPSLFRICIEVQFHDRSVVTTVCTNTQAINALHDAAACSVIQMITEFHNYRF